MKTCVSLLMKIALAATLLLVSLLPAAAAEFPGLKTILSDAEWKRAGLDKLTPDQIGVIDAAMIRYQAGVTAPLQAEIATAREAAATAKTDTKPGWLEHFGLPSLHDDWRSLPSLKAKVLKWEGGNRFVLDNGQVWQGEEPVVYDIIGKDIEIQPRPHGQFTLVLEGVNTKLRVSRVR